MYQLAVTFFQEKRSLYLETSQGRFSAWQDKQGSSRFRLTQRRLRSRQPLHASPAGNRVPFHVNVF